jgi:outer membrane protein assembly factor BamE (lipoprotein component of BamABCDE complex)
VLRWQQVLTEDNFNRVRAGQTSDELLLMLGRPSERRSGDWQGGQVWSYRYETQMGLCQWFQVSLNDGHIVTSSAYGIDPRCDVNDKDRSRE